MTTLRPPVPVTRVLVQCAARLDSLGALYLLINADEGERQYPGIRSAKIALWGTGTVSKDGKTWQDYEKEGTLLVGVGGGPLDEHPSPDFGNRKATGESTMSLTAKMLGIDNDPRYRFLIQKITQGDLQGSGIDTIASRVRSMHRDKKLDIDDVIAWAHTGIHSIVRDQCELADADKIQFKTKTVTAFGKNYKIGLAHADNYMIGIAAKKANITVVIQIRSNQQVLILNIGGKSTGAQMHNVAAALRYHELLARDQRKIAMKLSDEYLQEEGQLSEIPNWCYQVPGENLLNGSETAPDVEPTALPGEEIAELVCKYITFPASPQHVAPAANSGKRPQRLEPAKK